ncbi:MAG: cytochrome c family protein [Rhodocyclaceae bacterium]|nr:cytochrome c family protein [Rhodocyclaceae bacterium]
MRVCIATLALAVALAVPAAAADAPEYKGFRVCTKCHDAQGDAWKGTAHARAFESLRPGVKAEAKLKAKLDPAADYSANKDCVGCHTTGYGEAGGYRTGMDADEARILVGVGCEACHGPGGRYRNLHGEASDKLKSSGDTTPRRNLVDVGQNFDYERACARCHLNYPGSPLPTAAPPHTPFTPAVGDKYRHDFRKAVLAGDKANPVHLHFKLRGVFKGDPVPAIRAEVQAGARELED